jgi:hypothetical protein
MSHTGQNNPEDGHPRRITVTQTKSKAPCKTKNKIPPTLMREGGPLTATTRTAVMLSAMATQIGAGSG